MLPQRIKPADAIRRLLSGDVLEYFEGCSQSWVLVRIRNHFPERLVSGKWGGCDFGIGAMLDSEWREPPSIMIDVNKIPRFELACAIGDEDRVEKILNYLRSRAGKE
jgi:hypothetical protein